MPYLLTPLEQKSLKRKSPERQDEYERAYREAVERLKTALAEQSKPPSLAKRVRILLRSLGRRTE